MQAVINETAHRGDGGRGRKNRGQRFISYPHYTAFSARVQLPDYRLLMRLAVLLVDLAEALARAATRWECEQC